MTVTQIKGRPARVRVLLADGEASASISATHSAAHTLLAAAKKFAGKVVTVTPVDVEEVGGELVFSVKDGFKVHEVERPADSVAGASDATGLRLVGDATTLKTGTIAHFSGFVHGSSSMSSPTKNGTRYQTLKIVDTNGDIVNIQAWFPVNFETGCRVNVYWARVDTQWKRLVLNDYSTIQKSTEGGFPPKLCRFASWSEN